MALLTCCLCQRETDPPEAEGSYRRIVWGIRIGDSYIEGAAEYHLCAVCAHDLALIKRGEPLPTLPPVELQVARAYISWLRDKEAWGKDADDGRAA